MAIIQYKVLAMTDASTKSIQMKAVWILTDTIWSFEVKHHIYDKEQEVNTSKIAEAYIVLDFITMVEQKG